MSDNTKESVCACDKTRLSLLVHFLGGELESEPKIHKGLKGEEQEGSMSCPSEYDQSGVALQAKPVQVRSP